MAKATWPRIAASSSRSPEDDELMGDAGSESSAKRRDLFFPRGLSVFTRVHLWLRGYLDARKGKAYVSQGYVTSHFCTKLIQQADLRINAEWQDCNGVMFRLRPRLEQALCARDDAAARLEGIVHKKAARMRDVAAHPKEDVAISSHMAAKRERRRMTLLEMEFEAEETALRDVLHHEQAAVNAILAEYQDAKDVAVTHERLVRMEYVARLSCYARGASRRIPIELDQVNDDALISLPHEENRDYFEACERRAVQSEQDAS